MADLNSLIQVFKNAQTQANTANEARYSQLNSLYGGGTTSMADLIKKFSQTANNRIAGNMQTNQATATNDLAASGLGVPSVVKAMQKGIRSDAENQSLSVKEAATRQMAGGLAGKASAIEARTDAGPDMGMFAQLLQLAAMQNTDGASAGAISLASQPWSSSSGISRGWWNAAQQQGKLASLLTQRGY